MSNETLSFSSPYNNRILIVDDNESIHEDFEKTLPQDKQGSEDGSDFHILVREVLGPVEVVAASPSQEPRYQLAHAYQGEEAYRMVAEAEKNGQPFAVIFMDVRMPPGWDGIETIKRIWADYPYPEIVICTAYSDYSWEEILEKVGVTDQLQFLRKPFDVVSIKQMALALTKKWNLAAQSRQYTAHLEKTVAERTQELRQKIAELEKAMEEIRHLRGILPMCAWCHKIRTDEDYWMQVDEYISSHNIAEISHGICPECYQKLMKEVESSPSESHSPHSVASPSSSLQEKQENYAGERSFRGGIDLKSIHEQIKLFKQKTHPPMDS